MNSTTLVRDVFLAQSNRAVLFESFISANGRGFRLRGERTKILNSSIPSVVLVSRSVETAFKEAVLNLTTHGQKFYTKLNPDWALPTFVWTATEITAQ